MKIITRYFDGGFVKKIKLNFPMLYYHIQDNMPKGVKWIVDTGKTKRLYFWFSGNKYQGNQLCWSKLLI